ncbi:MAG TPA: GntR family transcriptional regulator [Candidatus Methylacidiphilales bacterium]
MLPFTIEFKPGTPVSEQLAYAVKKAAISGQLQPGERFPSVRVLSQELRINPNTAHKVVAALVAEGFLEVHPGIGTVVGKTPQGTAQQRGELLGAEVERLVVEAKKLRLPLSDVQDAIEHHWERLS